MHNTKNNCKKCRIADEQKNQLIDVMYQNGCNVSICILQSILFAYSFLPFSIIVILKRVLTLSCKSCVIVQHKSQFVGFEDPIHKFSYQMTTKEVILGMTRNLFLLAACSCFFLRYLQDWDMAFVGIVVQRQLNPPLSLHQPEKQIHCYTVDTTTGILRCKKDIKVNILFQIKLTINPADHFPLGISE